MKIFSWVHHKLNQKDGLFGGNVKKDEVIISKNENIGDKQLLLQDDSMAHMLGGCWKGGILTIGTFGFSPLLTDQLTSGLNDDIEDHEECEIIEVSDHEEENPSMNANNVHELISHHEAPMANEITGGNVPVARRTDDDESNKGSKKERITLADLFSADQLSDEENAQLPDSCDVTNVNKKTSKLPQVKNGVSFAKKIIPRVREDSRRILKLHKLMTKALKKKVHPDMESKNNNSRVLAAPAATSTMLKRTVTSESISLLEILETTA
ncbi:unnamed protein product [Withania somnifera]